MARYLVQLARTWTNSQGEEYITYLWVGLGLHRSVYQLLLLLLLWEGLGKGVVGTATVCVCCVCTFICVCV